jgi:hypothetical protein
LILVYWAPVRSRHNQFSKLYRDAVFTLIFITYCSPAKRIDQTKRWIAIPSFIMMNILTYTSRDWFNPIVTELVLLAEDLIVERKMRIEAEEKLKKQTESLRHMEREIVWLKVLLRRNNNQQEMEDEYFDIDDDDDDDEHIDQDEDEDVEDVEVENEDEEVENEDEDENGPMNYNSDGHIDSDESSDDESNEGITVFLQDIIQLFEYPGRNEAAGYNDSDDSNGVESEDGPLACRGGLDSMVGSSLYQTNACESETNNDGNDDSEINRDNFNFNDIVYNNGTSYHIDINTNVYNDINNINNHSSDSFILNNDFDDIGYDIDEDDVDVHMVVDNEYISNYEYSMINETNDTYHSIDNVVITTTNDADCDLTNDDDLWELE